MSIYVIGDLHLSFENDKPMGIFGENWENHYEKIKINWIKKVKEDDLVLLTGDISWALKFKEADSDFKWIDNLPGEKIIIKGNHDYWWTSLKKMNNKYKSIKFIHNNYYVYKNVAICGSRGWVCPGDNEFSDHDQKIYLREANRLKRSIEKAKKDGYNNIIVMMHYPPTNNRLQASKFTKLFEKYEIKKVFYGHLHTENSFKKGIKGMYNNVFYSLTACDYLDFTLYKVR